MNRGLFPGPIIPIASISEIAFNPVQVGVDPSTRLRGIVLDQSVSRVPVTLGSMPEPLALMLIEPRFRVPSGRLTVFAWGNPVLKDLRRGTQR